MASATYALFLAAMREKKQVICVYQGQRRELCPILLGRTGLEEKALVFQFGGSTSEGPVKPGGDWKCLKLAEVRNAALRDGAWHSLKTTDTVAPVQARLRDTLGVWRIVSVST